MVKCPNCGKDITEVVKDTSYTNARQIEIYKIENGEVTSLGFGIGNRIGLCN